MPSLRNRETVTTSDTYSSSPERRKRKRGEVTGNGSDGAPSPRSRKRTKPIDVHASVSPRTPRTKNKKVTLAVEKEVTTKASTGTNGTFALKEKAKATIKHTETPTKGGSQRKARVKTAKKAESDSEEYELEEDKIEQEDPVKPKRKRKTKEEKEAEAMPFAVRTVGLKMYVGAHTSIAKGVENAVTNCVQIGGNAFACFLKSQRKWENPALKNENRDAFKKALIDYKYDGMSHVVPHGSYLVNLATEDEDKAKQSYGAFVDDLHRCEALGIRYYNFHPGGAGQSSFAEAVTRLANNLNRALSETKTVVPLLENMAGAGTLIGGRFSDLRDVISQIKPEYQSRIGVCIDTCHAFAAGYDLRSPQEFKKTMDEFDRVVGFKYLKALHLNDSKMPLNSHRDLHQNIGLGFLGLRTFHNVMNESRFQNMPLILETPCERPDPTDPKGKKMIEDKSIWATEIKLLESLIGMDPASEEFERLESELSEKGKKERDQMQAQYERLQDKKAEQERKKLAKEKQREKGQKSLTDMFAGKQTANAAKSKRQKRQKRRKEDDSQGSKSSELSELSDLSDSGDADNRI
ncbi:AP endonuclease 1 [Cladophialophora psammophila CBS 110553]|uniref:Apurinic-apyrimidinic endonuclease 1 n=1 Tax=Cladophialophora psammophila CBS 110553 TaxID=1182543 RepID=W9X828_9EURO|nr:AP endonuclease 1 [Cladophialophora psammophila CBS 110553]EXJ76343.1 AP endonuclease 1 [Cladophialophora psammophila CBS 110553]